MKKSHCICIFLNVLSKIGPFFCLFSWEVFTVISRKILFFWEKCHFEKNPIFFRKRQGFLMIITACSQCQPVEKFWLDAALGKMWRNFVFLQNSLFSWKMWRKFSFSQKILNFLEKSLLSFWENVEKILSFSPKLRFFLKINFFIKIC